MAPADTEQSPVQKEMSSPPHNIFLETQDMVPVVEDYPPVRSSGEQQGLEMQDIAYRVVH